MTRLAAPLCLAMAAAAAVFLFHVKYQVREIERTLATTHRAILDHQEALQVLRTEWSYLNHPARIADLATRHLGLRPIPASQVIRLEDLPARAARLELADHRDRGPPATSRPSKGGARKSGKPE
ncbi:MAG: hypothetical protein ACE5GS_06935 [Kiloniellaceae bacterium]